MKKLVPVLIVWICATFSLQAGGSSSDDLRGVEAYGKEAINAWTEDIIQSLYDKEIDVAILARSGRLPEDMPDGITYTHVAFAVFEPMLDTQTGETGWSYACYNLYRGKNGDKDFSYLAQDTVWNMTAGALRKDIGIIIPVEHLQEQIKEMLHAGVGKKLHNENYSILANPHDTGYDNCTSWLLKVTTAAIYQTENPEFIQGAINDHFYPSKVSISPLQALGSYFASGITLEDQPSGGPYTATFSTIADYLSTNNLLKEQYTVEMAEQ